MDEIDPAAREQVRRVRVLLNRPTTDRLDLLRSLSALADKVPLRDLAYEFGVEESSLRTLLVEAGEAPSVPHGFSGADPYEIAQRYAIGQLTREQAVDEIARWPHEPEIFEGWEGYTPGTWQKYVIPAFDAGLLDKGMYSEIQALKSEISTRPARIERDV